LEERKLAMRKILKFSLSSLIVLAAVGVLVAKYWDYVTNPWTRDGQVRAQVIQITPRVSGPIVNLPIKDNQLVKTGDLLFEIDPRTFEASLEQARAQLDETGDNYEALVQQVEAAKAMVAVSRAAITEAESSIKEMEAEIEKNRAEFGRQKDLLPQEATSQKAVDRAKANYEVSIEQRKTAVAGLAQSQASLLESEANLAEAKASLGALGDANASIRAARAAVRQAELNLEFTQVRAPVDGYVTNLNLRLGSQAVENQAALALVDINSYWITGFFKENYIGNMRKGERAIVTLMTYPDKPLDGRVDSLGWGIAQDDGSTGFDLLPNISPTFEWIRLAQRVPVRIHLLEVPEEVKLRVGTTASVLVMTGTSGSESKKAAVAAPRALQ
jgi:multidrug resistance efflux pump